MSIGNPTGTKDSVRYSREEGAAHFGTEVELETDQHLKPPAVRIEDVLPYRFS